MAKSVVAPPPSVAPSILKKPFSFTYIYWGVFALYALIILYGVTNHEPWRDEAQSWLLVRDLSVGDLLRLLPHESHPPLWYFLIMPFAKGGIAYQSEQWLTAFIMIASVFILFFKTRLPFYLKITLVFSYYFFFEYALISRNYCLIVFFITLILALYPRRFDKPWLFALAVAGLFNSHVIAFTLAGSIAAVYFIDILQYKKGAGKTYCAFILMAISGGYLIPYFFLKKTSSDYVARIQDHALEIKKAINGAFFIYDDMQTLSILLLIVLAVLLFQRPKAFLIFISGAIGVFYILGYKYVGTLRHQGVLFLVVFASYGIANYYEEGQNMKPIKFDLLKIGSVILSLLCLYQAKSSYGLYSEDQTEEFSTAKATAEYLIENNLTSKIIVGEPAWAVSAVLPFLGKGVIPYNADCNKYGTYMVYDSCYFNKGVGSNSDAAAYCALTTFKDKLGSVILLVNSPLQEPQFQQMFQLIYAPSAQPMKKDEAFFVYRYGSDPNIPSK